MSILKDKKLYLATVQIKPFEILFASHIGKNDHVRASDAAYYAEQEIKEGHSYSMEVSYREITRAIDIPAYCLNHFVYGAEEINPTQLLKEADTEYQEYLRLKVIYEK